METSERESACDSRLYPLNKFSLCLAADDGEESGERLARGRRLGAQVHLGQGGARRGEDGRPPRPDARARSAGAGADTAPAAAHVAVGLESDQLPPPAVAHSRRHPYVAIQCLFLSYQRSNNRSVHRLPGFRRPMTYFD